MTSAEAILFATAADGEGRPAAALAWEDTTLLGRLLEQLAGLGVARAHVVTRPEWTGELEPLLAGFAVPTQIHTCTDLAADVATVAAIAQARDGALILANAEIVTQREALAGVLADPGKTAVLATRRRFPSLIAPPIRSRRGLLLRVATPYHRVSDATLRFLGVVKVAAQDRPRLGAVAEELSVRLVEPLPEAWEGAAAAKGEQFRRVLERRVGETGAEDDDHDVEDGGDGGEHRAVVGVALPPAEQGEFERHVAAARRGAPALLLHGLVRASVPVGFSLLRRLFWARPLNADEVTRAAALIVNHDEEQALLESAVKKSDGFFTTFFVSPYSKYLARWAARRGLTPNAVTVASMAVGLMAAAAFAAGDRAGMVAGAVLLQIAFTLDCVDGQLARYTRTFTRFGAWLDSILDRAKEYAVFAGLALGSREDVWLLAGAALALQTVRHTYDMTWNIARDQSIDSLLHQPLRRRALFLAERSDDARGTVAGWLRRIALLPIGERFALISLTAALFDARATFLALLVWGALALAYSVGGALRRSLGPRALTSLTGGPGSAPGPLPALRDDGPLVRAFGATAAWGPALPPVIPLTAGAAVLAAAIALTGDDAAWAVVAAVAGWVVLCGGAAAARPQRDRLRWLVPPLIAALEFAGLLWVAACAGQSGLMAAYVLLAAIAFRRYDLFYRWRHQGVLPPALLAAGWELRLLGAMTLGAAGALPAALWAGGAVLAAVLVGESVASWRRFDTSAPPLAGPDPGD